MSTPDDSDAVVVRINDVLKKISRRLFARSLNYCADFVLVKCKRMAGESLNDVVLAGLGADASIGGWIAAEKQDVLDELGSGLRFRGDDGSHPSRNYLLSREFQQDSDLATSLVDSLIDEGELIFSFWLEKGHPFYPVFWDFAFMIEKGPDAYVFIGSSSD